MFNVIVRKNPISA